MSGHIASVSGHIASVSGHIESRDGSRFSNIRIFYLIIEYRLGCAIISKGVPGLDNTDCPMA